MCGAGVLCRGPERAARCAGQDTGRGAGCPGQGGLSRVQSKDPQPGRSRLTLDPGRGD